MADLYEELRARLKRKLSPQRFRHSAAVSELTGLLAKKYGWNLERARLAGLLHDCVKEWSPRKMTRYVKKNHVEIPNLAFIQSCAPNMMHAYIAAHYVRKKGWLKKKNDLRAIASHTLGRRKMTLEEKILYIADFTEPGRPYTATAAEIRLKAMIDLDAAFREAVSNKIGWQLKKGKPIHPYALSVWNRVVCHVKD